jgi:hypothetical protein
MGAKLDWPQDIPIISVTKMPLAAASERVQQDGVAQPVAFGDMRAANTPVL